MYLSSAMLNEVKHLYNKDSSLTLRMTMRQVFLTSLFLHFSTKTANSMEKHTIYLNLSAKTDISVE